MAPKPRATVAPLPASYPRSRSSRPRTSSYWPKVSPPSPRVRSLTARLWLLWLKRLRFVSGLAAVLTTTGALGVYSLTDRTRQEWNAGRETLDRLRRQERQLTATLSELEHRQTSQMYAEPGPRQRVKPTTAVFAPVAPPRPE
ncbi:MAG: hypothetical protein ACUVSQ_11340, partial [Pseudanabaenaceae cyanobacterium]